MNLKAMQNAVVVTSIFEPSEAIKSYARLDGYHLIVVGDKKTPAKWSSDGVEFLAVERHKAMGFELASALPFNHYSRKMLGYLRAAQLGFECIIDTDDDNHPKPNWGFPGFDGEFETLGPAQGFVNMYRWFTNQHIWPRGLPLDMITHNPDVKAELSIDKFQIGVWQGLADGDPDVDAIYRMTSDQPCNFDERNPLVLQDGTVCPFNSQNTAFRKELLPLMYLPAHVTFRFTDILRGLIAQPIMWLHGYHLGFTQATVVQDRNPHDYMNDFDSELPMYQHCRSVVETVSTKISAGQTIESNLYNAYDGLRKNGIVVDLEMRTLEAWLRDLQHLDSLSG